MTGKSLSCDLVYLLRQRHVALTEAVAVVRGQQDVDAVIDVEPFRMVVGLLRHQCDAVHEAPGLVESLELEGALDGVASFHRLPARQLLQRCRAFRRAELLDHRVPPQWPVSVSIAASRTGLD